MKLFNLYIGKFSKQVELTELLYKKNFDLSHYKTLSSLLNYELDKKRRGFSRLSSRIYRARKYISEEYSVNGKYYEEDMQKIEDILNGKNNR